ncbi:MAG: sugar kinase [Ruminococcaceae bacterium]|nr:sugar kinase [Oscillospiraceae bacterium]
MKKVIGFGDYILRLNPEGYLKFIQADRFCVFYTGAEANVCTSLAYMGMPTQFVTRLPDNAIAECALSTLCKYRVGIDHIARGGERIGIFYLEKGASQRPSKIVYDRMHSGFTGSKLSDYNWDRIFDGAGWFHFTGITPALGGELPEICLAACKKAKELGLTVSCDLNYRKNLWSRAEAKATMEQLLAYVDVLIANEEDAADVLDIHASNTDILTGKLDREGYIEVADKISKKYSIPAVAITLRGSISASENDWSALLYEDGEAHFSKNYRIHLVDRVGGGDSFGAGLIWAMTHDYDTQAVIEYAAAASCLKQTIELDVNLSKPEDILKLAGGDGSGRVQR